MPLDGLSPQQNQFLDSYIRKHRVKGRNKKKRAESYSASREELDAQLARLPSFHPRYAELHGRLAEIDPLADALSFNRAKALADEVAQAVKQEADAYNPAADLTQLENDFATLDTASRQASAQLQTFQTWSATTGAGILGQLQPIPDQSIPDLDQLDFNTWAKALGSLLKQKAADLQQLEASFKSGMSQIEPPINFAGSANDRRQRLRTTSADLAKGCSAAPDQQRLFAVNNQIGQMIPVNLQSPMNRATFVERDELVQLRDRLQQQFVAAVTPIKEQIQTLRDELRDAFDIYQEAGDQEQGAKGIGAGDAKLGAEVQRDLDAVLGNVDAPGNRWVRPVVRFNAAPFLQTTSKYVLPPGTEAEDSPEFQQQVTVSRNLFRQHLQTLNLDPNGDQMFDLLLKGPKDFAREYAIARGWLGLPGGDSTGKRGLGFKNLSPEQRATALANGQGMHAATLQFQPNAIDLDGDPKTLTVGNEQYIGGDVIGQGGLGKILRFQSANDPQRVIVVKSMLAETPEQRKGIVREVQNHRHLMKGAPNARGRANVVDLQGTVQSPDGTLHMIMESVEGGDLDHNRLALTVATEIGVLPEEARTVLNQHRFKQAVEGMIYVRDQNTVHFDIKGANFLVTPDGQVKVADFGSAGVSGSPDGVIQRDPTDHKFTPGYGESEVPTATNTFDTFALGKLVQVMQQNLHDPPVAKWSSDPAPKIEGLTGALDRMTRAMTNLDPNGRISLEGVLETSYMKNLENYSKHDVKELSRATVAYGKALKKETAGVRATLTPEQTRLATPPGRTADDISMGDIVATAKGVINKGATQIAQLRKEFSKPGVSREKRFEIERQIQALTQEAESWKAKIAMFGQSPEAKELAAQVKEISYRLLHPSSAGEDLKALQEFRQTLASTINDPAQFANFVGLPSSGAHLTALGVDARALAKAAACYQMDTSERNPQAVAQLAAAHDQIRTFLATFQDPALQRSLGTGLLAVVKSLEQQIQIAGLRGAPELKKALESAASDAAAFHRLVTLPASLRQLHALGVDGAALTKVASSFTMDTSANNANAHAELSEARNQARAFLGTVKDEEFRRVLGQGLLSILRAVEQKVTAIHG